MKTTSIFACLSILLAHLSTAEAAPDSGPLVFSVPVASLANHNTSASPIYNQATCPANFGPAAAISSTKQLNINPELCDLSLNPVTPGHVSSVDVHTLIPSRPDLRWFAHLTPWFIPGGPHIGIGVNNDTDEWVEAAIRDMKSRGFNGAIIDWWGPKNPINSVTLRIKNLLARQPKHDFTYIIQIDRVKTPEELQNLIAYCEEMYFTDPNYEREAGKPILMFFGVESNIGSKNMAAVKSRTKMPAIWVPHERFWESKPSRGEAWNDGVFAWTDDFKDGVNAQDPYNLAKITSFYSKVAKYPSKKIFAGICPSFNGTLTKKKAWSLGKHLPSDYGACLIERAKLIDQVITPNVTRVQWITWQDYEEGSAIEPGIENDIRVTAIVSGGNLTWTVSGGTGDERTIDHFDIYASMDGQRAAHLAALPAGTHRLKLDRRLFESGKSYNLYVNAVGRPCIRDHLSAAMDWIAK